MFTRAVKICLPLFSCPTSAKRIVLSPLPRYWRARCCSDKDHVANLEDPDFERMIFSGLDSFRRLIKDVLFTSGVGQVSVYNSGQLCSGMPGARHTTEEIRDALAILWGEDPVHPASICYEALANGLQAIITPEATNSDIEPATFAVLERPHKRPRWLEADACPTVDPRGGGRGRGTNWRGRGGRGGQRGRGFWGLY
jgi:hypothetical protein